MEKITCIMTFAFKFVDSTDLTSFLFAVICKKPETLQQIPYFLE